MRPYTENERQRLIAFNRAIIEQHESYAIPVDLMPYHIRMMVYSARIALASLEAKPVVKVTEWMPLGIDGGVSKFLQPVGNLPDFGAFLYTAPPVPAMQTVDLSSVDRMLGRNDWLKEFDVVAAIRAAGGEVKK